MGNRQRTVLLVLALIVAVVAVIATRPGGDDQDDVIDTRTQATTPTTTMSTTTEPARRSQAEPAADPTIVVRGGKPVGGVKRLRFRKGGNIVFVVQSDEDAEIHLHGYDIPKDVDAGGSVRFDVPAKIDGRFEVELEDSATQLAEIEVVP
ncbi:MAG: hypothetical protein ACJ762_13520 [Solirubrobacteraceae bacterium]